MGGPAPFRYHPQGENLNIHSSRLLIAALFLHPVSARAQEPSAEEFQFFSREARVVSAAFKPTTSRKAPATVYVVTADDIKASGALTVWDALRKVPGVDVMAPRAGQGEVGIRGLNKRGNNRVLVLLDGRTMLEPFNDAMLWDSLPVSMDEIDRIEVVVGPASALYGSNALSGVVNVITKTPEKIEGGRVRYRGGERSTHEGTALYGANPGALAYKLGASIATTNRFSDGGLLASRTGKFHALARWDLAADSSLSLSGGLSDLRTQTSDTTITSGIRGFLRADYRWRDTRARAFWNRGRQNNFSSALNTSLDYDTYDGSIEQSLALHETNELTAGASYRRNGAASSLFTAYRTADLWALYAEDQWRWQELWTMVASARLDKHPFIPWMVSPRASLLWEPWAEHVIRASAGLAFRGPTLVENWLETNLLIPATPSLPVPILLLSGNNKDMKPERMTFFELAHDARYERWKTRAALFQYKIRDLSGAFVNIGAGNPLPVTIGVVNDGETTAMGGELGGELALTRRTSVFANYSYEQLYNSTHNLATSRATPQTSARSAPRHKGNVGLQAKELELAGGKLTSGLWAHVVDKTYWNQNTGLALGDPFYAKVPAYVLLNGSLSYGFGGRWDGLEAGVAVFNLLQKAHYEILDAAGGDVIRQRWTATLAYRFGGIDGR